MTVHPNAITELDNAAIKAAQSSYSPYSNFKVGAALLLDNGPIITGTNIENASYGLTICAERCAIFSAVAAGYAGHIQALSVVCPNGDPLNPNSLMPCGACRQVMAEHLKLDAPISVVGVGVFKLSELLPKPFILKSE